MEPTFIFAEALTEAKRRLDRQGKVSQRDHKAVDHLLTHQIIAGRERPRLLALKQVHWKVRRLYERQHNLFFATWIDWSQLVDWIMANWAAIMRIILTVLPFLGGQ